MRHLRRGIRFRRHILSRALIVRGETPHLVRLLLGDTIVWDIFGDLLFVEFLRPSGEQTRLRDHPCPCGGALRFRGVVSVFSLILRYILCFLYFLRNILFREEFLGGSLRLGRLALHQGPCLLGLLPSLRTPLARLLTVHAAPLPQARRPAGGLLTALLHLFRDIFFFQITGRGILPRYGFRTERSPCLPQLFRRQLPVTDCGLPQLLKQFSHLFSKYLNIRYTTLWLILKKWHTTFLRESPIANHIHVLHTSVRKARRTPRTTIIRKGIKIRNIRKQSRLSVLQKVTEKS